MINFTLWTKQHSAFLLPSQWISVWAAWSWQFISGDGWIGSGVGSITYPWVYMMFPPIKLFLFCWIFPNITALGCSSLCQVSARPKLQRKFQSGCSTGNHVNNIQFILIEYSKQPLQCSICLVFCLLFAVQGVPTCLCSWSLLLWLHFHWSVSLTLKSPAINASIFIALCKKRMFFSTSNRGGTE